MAGKRGAFASAAFHELRLAVAVGRNCFVAPTTIFKTSQWGSDSERGADNEIHADLLRDAGLGSGYAARSEIGGCDPPAFRKHAEGQCPRRHRRACAQLNGRED